MFILSNWSSQFEIKQLVCVCGEPGRSQGLTLSLSLISSKPDDGQLSVEDRKHSSQVTACSSSWLP